MTNNELRELIELGKKQGVVNYQSENGYYKFESIACNHATEMATEILALREISTIDEARLDELINEFEIWRISGQMEGLNIARQTLKDYIMGAKYAK